MARATSFRILAIHAALVLATFGTADAQDCSAARVTELKQQCLVSLQDIEAMNISAKNRQDAATAKLLEAVEPGYECGKGGLDLLRALATTCNPTSPALNPVECVITLTEVPDTVASCKKAIAIVSESLVLFREAKSFYGAAGVAFFDQGTDVIAQELAACNHPTCQDLGSTLTDNAQAKEELVNRNIQRIVEYRDGLQNNENTLTACQNDPYACVEVPLVEFPTLETDETSVPPIILD